MNPIPASSKGPGQTTADPCGLGRWQWPGPTLQDHLSQPGLVLGVTVERFRCPVHMARRTGPLRSRVYAGRKTTMVPLMAKNEMRVVGKVKLSPWQRFVQLQRTAGKLTRGRGQPKGVFRFKTHEDANRWTEAQRTR